MSVLDANIFRPSQGGPSYAFGQRLFRFGWRAVWLVLAAWTPAPLHVWRVLLLNLFGADVDRKAHVYGSARIWYPPNLKMGANSCLGPGVICYSMAQIRVEEGAVVSQRAHLCAGTHDITHPEFQLVVRPIVIGARAWVAAEAFVGPGVTIGEGAVIGARGVLFKDAEAYGVYVGNPAVLMKRRDLLKRDGEQNV